MMYLVLIRLFFLWPGGGGRKRDNLSRTEDTGPHETTVSENTTPEYESSGGNKHGARAACSCTVAQNEKKSTKRQQHSSLTRAKTSTRGIKVSS